MTHPDSSSYGVWIGDRRAGTIQRVGDRTRFFLDFDYREDPGRPVLGLVFEDRPERVHVATVRVAPWFSNLLPRDEHRGLVHIEDLAQVRNVYPEQKYKGNFETVASLIYRGRDKESLLEFTRRLAFSVLISNDDYHLKNWSLIYPDGRIPVLAPAYDLRRIGARLWCECSCASARRKAARLAAHLALQPGQLVIDISRVMPGQRTAVGGLADLPVGPVPRKLLTVERRLDGEDDGSDDERGDRGLYETPMSMVEPDAIAGEFDEAMTAAVTTTEMITKRRKSRMRKESSRSPKRG